MISHQNEWRVRQRNNIWEERILIGFNPNKCTSTSWLGWQNIANPAKHCESYQDVEAVYLYVSEPRSLINIYICGKYTYVFGSLNVQYYLYKRKTIFAFCLWLLHLRATTGSSLLLKLNRPFDFIVFWFLPQGSRSRGLQGSHTYIGSRASRLG